MNREVGNITRRPSRNEVFQKAEKIPEKGEFGNGLCLLHAPVYARVKLLETGRTNAVRESGLRIEFLPDNATRPAPVSGLQTRTRAAQRQEAEQRELQRPPEGRGISQLRVRSGIWQRYRSPLRCPGI